MANAGTISERISIIESSKVHVCLFWLKLLFTSLICDLMIKTAAKHNLVDNI